MSCSIGPYLRRRDLICYRWAKTDEGNCKTAQIRFITVFSTSDGAIDTFPVIAFKVSFPMMKLIRALAILLTFVVVAFPASAQEDPTQFADADISFKTWEANAVSVDLALKSDWEGEIRQEDGRLLMEQTRSAARSMADKAKAAIGPIQAQLDAIGAVPVGGETEPDTLTIERSALQTQLLRYKATASKAELAFTRADRLLDLIATARRQKLTEILLERGPTPLEPKSWLEVVKTVHLLGITLAAETKFAAGQLSDNRALTKTVPIALAALLFAVVIMVVARRAMLRRLYRILGAWTPQPPGDDVTAGTDISTTAGGNPWPASRSRTTRLFVGIGVTVTRLATPLVALFAARFALRQLQILGPTGEIIFDGFVGGAMILALAYAIVYAFFAPEEPRLRLSMLDNTRARTSARYAMLIALATALSSAVVDVGEIIGWPIAALSVVNAVMICGGSVALWCLARVSGNHEALNLERKNDEITDENSEQWLSRGGSRVIRRFGYGVSLVSPLLALAGYFALSQFVFYNALFSAAVIAAGILIFSVAKEGTSALSEATRDHNTDKIKESDTDGGLLPVFVGFILILLALPLLALIWGATRADLGNIYFALTNGFTIGGSTFRPGDLLIAAVVFGASIFITRVVQAIMRRTVMPRTRLDTGTRSSIVSGLGYLGFFIAVLTAISAGGLDLTNLAFLGAALGVGIGFGLQNIVNNFVSGIILLIERPIKIGDWIEVAGTHGIVQKVNVRSTEIRTFDKASYIVPNSELISGAVMNMTHGDLMGRVIAPVGVAYGTDTRKVEKILMDILRAHPMILRQPPPQVIFKGFGADSLDFEARGFLRDVNWIIATHSDLNFEIDRRFREEKVEIPFKQTDVNLKNLDLMVEALRAGSAQSRPSGHPVQGTIGY